MEPWQTTKVLKKNVKIDALAEMTLTRLTCQRISEEKQQNLLAMIPYLKEENSKFYEGLLKPDTH